MRCSRLRFALGAIHCYVSGVQHRRRLPVPVAALARIPTVHEEWAGESTGTQQAGVKERALMWRGARVGTGIKQPQILLVPGRHVTKDEDGGRRAPSLARTAA